MRLTLWRLRMALDCSAKRRVVNPKDVETVQGHCTVVSLLCSEHHHAMFNSVCTFVRRLRHCTAAPPVGFRPLGAGLALELAEYDLWGLAGVLELYGDVH
eukprot:6884285-Pyramimonas_sp.AAC.1